MRTNTLFAFIFTCIYTLEAVELPPEFKVCNRDDPNFNKCLKKSLKSLIPIMGNGFPGLKVPPLDPYIDREAHLEFKQNQVSLKFVVYNASVEGFSKSKVHDVRADLQDDSFYIEVDLSAKRISSEGTFTSQGRLNAFTVNNRGYFNNTMDDLVWTWKIKGSIITKNDKKYVKITKFFMRPEVGNMKIYMSDILPGNPELSKLFRDFANANWRILYVEFLPFAEANWDRTGKKICNKIFSRIPYDELFPTDSED